MHSRYTDERYYVTICCIPCEDLQIIIYLDNKSGADPGSVIGGGGDPMASIK